MMASPEPVRRRRPLGITILGGLVLLASLVLAIAGLAGMFLSFASLIPGSQIPGANLFVGGLIFFVIAIILGIAGAGLLRLKVWAWWLAFLVALGSLAWTAYGLYSASSSGAAFELSSLVTVVIVAVIFVYLITVYGRFRKPKAEAPVKTK